MIIYKAPFCDVYRINRNTKNEYYIVDTKKIYTEETIPVSPFNRDKAGIDNIIKFKNQYLEKCLLYNTVSIFSLIDNVQEITFNFSSNSYKVNRKQIEKLYPNYSYIISNEINRDNFNKYLENKMNDNEFIKSIFNKIFSN